MQLCNKCGSTNIIFQDVEFMQFFGCYDCGANGKPYGYESCCKSQELIHIMFEQSNGSWVRRTACKNCKTVKGKAIAKGNDYNELPYLTNDKYKEYIQNYERVRTLIQGLSLDFIREKQRLDDIKDKNIYHNYLKTDAWKSKAALVRKRDNNICQACLSAPAEEVHHLTYQNIFKEPLFELVSVCHACHSKIHNH